MREEGNTRRGRELCGVMKLQAGISESRRFFRSNGLPGSWGWALFLVRPVRNQFHKVSLR